MLWVLLREAFFSIVMYVIARACIVSMLAVVAASMTCMHTHMPHAIIYTYVCMLYINTISHMHM